MAGEDNPDDRFLRQRLSPNDRWLSRLAEDAKGTTFEAPLERSLSDLWEVWAIGAILIIAFAAGLYQFLSLLDLI